MTKLLRYVEKTVRLSGKEEENERKKGKLTGWEVNCEI